MDLYLDELIRQKIEEARAMGAHCALVNSITPVRPPMRVAVGNALIRIGHWVAGHEPRRSHASGVTA